MAVSPKLRNIIEKYYEDLEIGKFDNLVRDVICEDVLDELLDFFYEAEVTIPPEIVTKQLYDFYIKRVINSEEERDCYMRKINHLINKHQIVIVKTLDAPKK